MYEPWHRITLLTLSKSSRRRRYSAFNLVCLGSGRGSPHTEGILKIHNRKLFIKNCSFIILDDSGRGNWPRFPPLSRGAKWLVGMHGRNIVIAPATKTTTTTVPLVVKWLCENYVQERKPCPIGALFYKDVVPPACSSSFFPLHGQRGSSALYLIPSWTTLFIYSQWGRTVFVIPIIIKADAV